MNILIICDWIRRGGLLVGDPIQHIIDPADRRIIETSRRSLGTTELTYCKLVVLFANYLYYYKCYLGTQHKATPHPVTDPRDSSVLLGLDD